LDGCKLRLARLPAALIALLALSSLAAAFAPQALAARGEIGDGRDYSPKPYEGPQIRTPNASRCDFLDTSVCLHPFPNDFFTRNDEDTATGLRIDLDSASMPRNVAGDPIDPTEYNRNDGFSPGQSIVLHVDGLESQRAFRRSGIVGVDDTRDYHRRGQPVVVINAETGERHPIFAELDANAERDRDRNLIIRPLVNFEEGQRYVVALRRLQNAQGDTIEAPPAFRVYRENLITDQRPIEQRRRHMERAVFGVLDDAGVPRGSLYMAWDFTVASAESIAGRALAMRDDAFGRLGDTNLSDLTIQGTAPAFRIDSVEESPEPQILRRVEGTLEDVPCYLNTQGCPPGARFDYAARDATKPTFEPTLTADVPFTCTIPPSVDGGDGVIPARPSLYGHGLLSTREDVANSYVVDFGTSHNLVFCAVDWAGFSEEDVGPVILPALSDISKLPPTFDRMQQGFVNAMLLGRAMIHPAGLSSDPAFRVDAGSGVEPVIDTTRLFYYGNSQGGIMGGALTALAPDFERSVLGVPGMNYSTLLQRSVDFDEYSELPDVGLYDNYPDQLERPVIVSLIQMLWDRGEANGYAHHMTTDPYPNTPPHQVLLHAAFGDHQVANLTAEIEARTIGARRLAPSLDDGRHWEERPYKGIPMIRNFPYTRSALVYWDGGPVGFNGTVGAGSGTPPDENVPPRPETGHGEDPHGYPRRAPEAHAQMSAFLRVDGAIVSPCAGGGPCYANGYAGP
jgi:hypothetical protein